MFPHTKGTTITGWIKHMHQTCSEADDGTVLNGITINWTGESRILLQDATLSQECTGDPCLLYADLRAACESGWDLADRWFKDGKHFQPFKHLILFLSDLIAPVPS
jgi:hypothetical protein